MNSVLTIAAKDLRLLSRDWMGMFFIAGLPILMGLMFGLIGGSFSSGSASLSIAVVDDDRSEISRKFVAHLEGLGSVTVRSLDQASALEQVRKGQLVGAVLVPKGFGETAGIFWEEQPTIGLAIDPSRQAEAGMLQGFVMQGMGELIGSRFRDPSLLRPSLQRSLQRLEQQVNVPESLRSLIATMFRSVDNLMAAAELQPEPGLAAGDNSTGFGGLQFAKIEQVDVTRDLDPNSIAATLQRVRSPWDISFPQAIAWGILGCVAGFAISIVRERERGTLIRLQVAPIARRQILLGKAVACFTMVVGVIVALVALGVMLGMRPRSYPLLMLSGVAIGCCFVGITMLMAVVGKSEEAVSGAGWGANVVMAMFGGGMIPLAFMPNFMQTASHFSPVKWAVLSLEGAIWRGFTFTEMLTPCTVLVAFGVVAGWLGLRVMSLRDR